MCPSVGVHQRNARILHCEQNIGDDRETLHLSGHGDTSVDHPRAEGSDTTFLQGPSGSIMPLDWESSKMTSAHIVTRRGGSAVVRVRKELVETCERCRHDQDAASLAGRIHKKQSFDSRLGDGTQSFDETFEKIWRRELSGVSAVARDDGTPPWRGPACGHGDKASGPESVKVARQILLHFDSNQQCARVNW